MKSLIKFKKLLFALILVIAIFFVSGCGEKENDPEVPQGTKDETGYVYEGTATVSPYKVYNQDGVLFGTFDSMFTAIRVAGGKSKNDNKMYVLDANELKIFQRQTNDLCWCFDGTFFVGVKSKNEARAWCDNKPRGYVVAGQGKGYVQIGTQYYENTDTSANIPLELISGGYNYLFSKSGEMVNGFWEERGYGYCEFYVRLSEASYKPTQEPFTDYDEQKTGNQWNAYIFVNGAGGNYTSDLGLIGVIRDDVLVWALVRNCSHKDHKLDPQTHGESFTVLSWTPVTTMKYDETADAYINGDDLFFQCYQGVDGWNLTITNLRTNQKFEINENHKNMFADTTQYLRFLIAASYCPVTNTVWNARCGAYLRGVVFDGMKIARWNESETYDPSMYEDFYPGSSNMHYGFSQGSDCSDMECGVYTEAGTYKSGEAKVQGAHYMIFDCYYDGVHTKPYNNN